MYAFHSGKQALDDWELAMMVLSALEWKKHNGPINIVGNKPFLEYIRKEGLSFLYDRHIEVEVPDCVDQKVFWAAIKLYAYQVMPVGTWFVDIDCSVGYTLPDYSADVIAAHYDDATGYLEGIDSLKGLNACVLCFNDKGLKDRYTQRAINYMETWAGGVNYSDYGFMIYAEQTLLLEESGGNYALLMPDFPDKIERITHLWADKKLYQSSESARNGFLKRIESYLCTTYLVESWQSATSPT